MNKTTTSLQRALILLLTAFGVVSSSMADARVTHHQHKKAYKKTSASGKASIYSDHFNGKKTATGERFHQSNLTAASPTLPLGSKVKVTNKKTGKSVVVKVNDRQPKTTGRILDLSKSAASKLGAKDGVMPVTTKVLGK